VIGTGEILSGQGENLSSSSDDTGNLEVLTEVGILDLRHVKENRMVLLKSGLGGLHRPGLLSGIPSAASPHFEARHRICRTPVHLCSNAKVSARGVLVVRLRAGMLKGTGAVGNLATTGLLRRGLLNSNIGSSKYGVPLLPLNMGYSILGDFEESAQERTVSLNIGSTQLTGLSDFQSMKLLLPLNPVAHSDFPTVFSHEPTPATLAIPTASTDRIIKAADINPLP
jgi:hypothetical protein